MRFLVFSLSYFGLRLSGEEGLKGAVFYDGRTTDYGVNGWQRQYAGHFSSWGFVCLLPRRGGGGGGALAFGWQ